MPSFTLDPAWIGRQKWSVSLAPHVSRRLFAALLVGCIVGQSLAQQGSGQDEAELRETSAIELTQGIKVPIYQKVSSAHGARPLNAGQFYGVHNVAIDLRGNVYTSEVFEAKRVQKWKVTERGSGAVVL